MRKIIFLSLLFLSSGYAFNDHDIKDQAEVEGFYLGDDSDLGGNFSYIVDRTSGLCFASLSSKNQSGLSSAITNVPCKSLLKIKAIKNYIEKGVKP